MSYRVVWMPIALQQLAALWMAASDRNAVTAAGHEIDLVLAAAPNSVGVILFDTVREFLHQSLGVEFEVDVAKGTVYVVSVWDTATGRPNVSGN